MNRIDSSVIQLENTELRSALRKKRMTIQRPPTVVGLKLCQHAIVEEKTRNVTVVNCFHKLSLATFPAQSKPFSACVVLTDGLGDSRLSLTVTSLEHWEEVWTRSWNVVFRDPLTERLVYHAGHRLHVSAGGALSGGSGH